MQFFDLSRQYNLNDILTPFLSLEDLSQHEWYLAKISVDYDCLTDEDLVEGSITLKSNHNVQIELAWLILDNGHELQVLFKGIETSVSEQTLVIVKGARLVDEAGQELSAQALSLWIDGTLLNMLPHIRKEIKSRLNLWDYVDYDV